MLQIVPKEALRSNPIEFDWMFFTEDSRSPLAANHCRPGSTVFMMYYFFKGERLGAFEVDDPFSTPGVKSMGSDDWNFYYEGSSAWIEVNGRIEAIIFHQPLLDQLRAHFTD